MNTPMKPIPITAAKRVADDFGYDQVVIIARRVGEEPDPCGEHVTTYGRSKAHCSVAAQIGDFLKFKVMGWVSERRETNSIARAAKVRTKRDAFNRLRKAIRNHDSVAAEKAWEHCEHYID
ncbi:hypothetical protein [Ruegeria sp. ANG-R]|uniref:hypothetical protein n=1 Tax=Ruegeria sp. ANG-R TaxID=1577903 RepID=UPI000A3E067B|nr:hypothetical protein [Ruegeria sp. ANG-R]